MHSLRTAAKNVRRDVGDVAILVNNAGYALLLFLDAIDNTTLAFLSSRC